jgi:hypothetical protein
MTSVRKTRRAIRIKRAANVKTYKVKGAMEKTGPRQTKVSAKTRRVKRSVAENTTKRVQNIGDRNKANNTTIAQLYAKAVHQYNTFKNMKEFVEKTTYVPKIKKAVLQKLKNFKKL